MNDLAMIDFDKAITLSKEEIQDFIVAVETKMKSSRNQVEVPLTHYFSKGVYGREVRIAKGTLAIGKIHKFQVMNVLSQGEVTVLSIDGAVRFKAPHTFVSSPGAKRLVYAHDDCVWTNFHGTDETDLEKIEKEFIAESFDQVEALDSTKKISTEESPCLGSR